MGIIPTYVFLYVCVCWGGGGGLFLFSWKNKNKKHCKAVSLTKFIHFNNNHIYCIAAIYFKLSLSLSHTHTHTQTHTHAHTYNPMISEHNVAWLQPCGSCTNKANRRRTFTSPTKQEAVFAQTREMWTMFFLKLKHYETAWVFHRDC